MEIDAIDKVAGLLPIASVSDDTSSSSASIVMLGASLEIISCCDHRLCFVICYMFSAKLYASLGLLFSGF